MCTIGSRAFVLLGWLSSPSALSSGWMRVPNTPSALGSGVGRSVLRVHWDG